jgi:hypothetical protein
MDDELKKQIFAEIEAAGLLQKHERRMRQPGDIDGEDMAAHLGVCERYGIEMITKIAKNQPDEYEKIQVYDPVKQRRVGVLRKKTPL